MERITLIYAAICIFLLCIVVRLFNIQVLSASERTIRGLSIQSQKPPRGKIYDVNGQILATNELSYTMFANPKVIKDTYNVSRRIGEAIGLNSATLEAKLKEPKQWVSLASNITKKQRDAVKNLEIFGIGFDETSRRLYKEASLAAHIIGFIGKDSVGEDTGYYGIEGYYDKELKGLEGRRGQERDVHGRPILFGIQDTIKTVAGSDITLTIDGAVQNMAKNKLKEGITKYGAKSGCIIVADPNNMNITALTCLPDFDQSEYYKYPTSYYRNPALQDTYEPGSTFKPLVVASAIDTGAVSRETTISEVAPIKISGYEIDNWNGKTEGTISVQRVLEKSSNIGMVQIGEKLGTKNLVSYIKKFGFGEKTGINLQGEVAAPLRKDTTWKELDYATATFGQGIAATPLQLMSGFASIINGGTLFTPNIVKKITYNGVEQLQKPQEIRKTVSTNTSAVMRNILESVVENGEYKYKKPVGYRFGGKTGTSQIANAGGYDEEKTVASFIGFTPVDKPKFLGFVMLNEPTAAIFGSETAAPLFFDLSKELLTYYNMSPEK
jgi:cell division protein FtsI/penicillin-binding protein 2